jgi:hypothetical protein
MLIVALILGGSILILILASYNAWVYGYLTLKFYYWFLLPMFPQLPQINIYEAIGLTLFISLFHQSAATRIDILDAVDGEKKDKVAAYVAAILRPWLMLGIGYFIYSNIIH